MLQDGMGWDGRCNGDGMGGMGDAMGTHCELLWGQDGDAAGMGWDGRCQLPALLPGCMVLQHGGGAKLLTELLLLYKGLI